MLRLIKMVRDRIPGLDGAAIKTQPLSVEEANAERRKKLVREALEYAMNPSVEELADVLELVHSLAEYDLEIPYPVLIMTMSAKNVERGGFDMGMGMYIETTPGTGEFS